MAIVYNLQIIPEYPWDAEQRAGLVSEGAELLKTVENVPTMRYNPETKESEQIGTHTVETWREVKYPGAVLCTRERNWADDSDFYAVVWDEKENRLRTEEYDSTRYGGGGYAEVDATDESKHQAAAWIAMWLEGRLADEYQAKSVTLTDGKLVKVVAGRKVPQGTEAVVFWYGEGRCYDYHTRPYRVGMRTADGVTYWTDARNVEVINPEQYVPAPAEIKAKAEGMAQRIYESNSGWHMPFAYGCGLHVL